MSWPEVFPVLDESQVEEYRQFLADSPNSELQGLFSVKERLNTRPARHLVATSLFWKPFRSIDRRLPTPVPEHRLAPPPGKVASAHPSIQEYLEPILAGAAKLGDELSDVVVRVYLAKDLGFLVDDLVEANCEVFVMDGNSICHNPGAMWRFLALGEENRLVTIVDAHRMSSVLEDIRRTESAAELGFGVWRTPLCTDFAENCVQYRPIMATHLGVTRSFPDINLLMEALVWHSLGNSISPQVSIGAKQRLRVRGSTWPDHGFDEWFLLCALYPRILGEQVLTLVNVGANSRFLALDVEMVASANPSSELVFFEKPQMKTGQSIVERSPPLGLVRLQECPQIPEIGLTSAHSLPDHALRESLLSGLRVNPHVVSRFNPSTIKIGTRRWLAYRTECQPMWRWGRISLAEVDDQFRAVPGENRVLDLPTSFGNWCAEDPRLFVHRDRMYLSYTDHWKSGLAEIDAGGELIRVDQFPIEVKGRPLRHGVHDKNWGFFSSGGELYASHWVRPHIVRQVDLQKWTFVDQWEVDWSLPILIGGELHGGSSPVYHEGLFWRAVHHFETPPYDEGGRRYSVWLMGFDGDPPFAPRVFCSKPILVGERTKETSLPEWRDFQVVFCASIERSNQGWQFLFGHNDRRMRYGSVADSTVAGHLIEIKSGRRPLVGSGELLSAPGE